MIFHGFISETAKLFTFLIKYNKLKTDHAEYFEFILGNLESLKDTYEIIEMTRDLHAGNPDAKSLTIPAVTLFEKLFIKDGLPIHSVKVRAKRG
ncbi:MAG: hypothetical protein EBX52_11365 [Proteobacteria bacterium]|nr:hypothetical protein [Pseudomonadota bacterium]